jgi:hypothetical protein
MAIHEGFAQVSWTMQGASALGSVPTVVFGISIGSVPLTDAADDVKTAIDTNFTGDFLAPFNLAHIALRSATEEQDRTLSLTASSKSNPASPSTSLLVKKVTELAGRANRGRFYFPGLLDDADVEDDGTVNPSTVTAFQGVMDNFVGDLAIAGLPMAILHRDGAATPTIVTGLQVESQVATQRRRNRK